mgnify:CR=1 FL=1
MDGTQFDAWTRRRFGLAAGGIGASLLGVAALDEAEAKRSGKKKRRRKRKRRKKGPHVCAGRNSCETQATCHRASSEVQCFCFVTAQTGKPYCSIGAVQVFDCSECESGQTCVDLSTERCGNLGIGCAEPCPSPKRR